MGTLLNGLIEASVKTETPEPTETLLARVLSTILAMDGLFPMWEGQEAMDLDGEPKEPEDERILGLQHALYELVQAQLANAHSAQVKKDKASKEMQTERLMIEMEKIKIKVEKEAIEKEKKVLKKFEEDMAKDEQKRVVTKKEIENFRAVLEKMMQEQLLMKKDVEEWMAAKAAKAAKSKNDKRKCKLDEELNKATNSHKGLKEEIPKIRKLKANLEKAMQGRDKAKAMARRETEQVKRLLAEVKMKYVQVKETLVMHQAKSQDSVAKMSQVKLELQCSVCKITSKSLLFQCNQGHLICQSCKEKFQACPQECGQLTFNRCSIAEKIITILNLAED